MQKDSFIKTLQETGAHLGYTRTRRHPTIKPFLFGNKNKTDIIDLSKTFDQVAQAGEFLRSLGATKKTLLMVSTKAEGKNTISRGAESIDMPYVTVRWVGGTLTNFGEIRRRVERLVDLQEKQETNTLVFKTKKEKLMLEREIEKLSKYFSGLVRLNKLPDALLIIDPRHNDIATLEALKLKIPVVAIANTDCSIAGIEFPIVANDASTKTLENLVRKLVDAYQEGVNSTLPA